mmetsp:Transcript_51065/g.123215  ORF Transcript_51065/g.123215 Transcript_51065/m.123215 type:complete len:595 (+) Transcript_51065:62-1846(+)
MSSSATFSSAGARSSSNASTRNIIIGQDQDLTAQSQSHLLDHHQTSRSVSVSGHNPSTPQSSSSADNPTSSNSSNSNSDEMFIELSGRGSGTTTPSSSMSRNGRVPAKVRSNDSNSRPNSTNNNSNRNRNRTSSFDVSLIPTLKMRKRVLKSFSVHYSVATASWVATIARAEDATTTSSNNINAAAFAGAGAGGCVSFQFPTEREARRFAKAYSPPKCQTGASSCVCCSAPFVMNANNSDSASSTTIGGGAAIAVSGRSSPPATTTPNSDPTPASSSVGTAMMATTHHNVSPTGHRTGIIPLSIHPSSHGHHHHHSINSGNGNSSNTKGRVRSFHCKNCGSLVCDKCSKRWGSKQLPKTYVNSSSPPSLTVRVCQSCDWLSNSFCMALLLGQSQDAIAVHETGNVNLRTTFAHIHKEAMFPIHCAVMGGSLELVKWMVESHSVPLSVKTKNGIPLSVETSKSRTLMDLAMTGRPKIDVLGYLVSKNLSVVDSKDPSLAPKTLQTLLRVGHHSEKGLPSISDIVDASGDLSSLISQSSHDSVASIENACIICCEKTMDCVLNPCGHQLCCSDCGSRLTQCPVCKRDCCLLKIRKV